MEKQYKTTRKYQCPYCDEKLDRSSLISHVGKKHEEMIPEGYSAARSVFDSINKTDHGTCMICKNPVYVWNEKLCRYNNLCDKKSCREAVRNTALKNHVKVYNKTTLLNEPEHQEKMLANRRISGTYKFKDGKDITYTGKYEKNTLEFMDKVLNIPSEQIQAPGPTLDYEYDGKTHSWITDIYYIPANLIIEIKDGGSNPNKRVMPEYRAKQYAKEDMITNLGTFSYLRLTDNNFAQLLEALADIKMNNMTHPKDPHFSVHINEEVGGIPPASASNTYIVPYMMNNVFDVALGNTSSDDVIVRDENDEFKKLKRDVFFAQSESNEMIIYTGDDDISKYEQIKSLFKKTKDPQTFVESVCMQDGFAYRNIVDTKNTIGFIESSILREAGVLTGEISVFDSDTPIKGAVFLAKDDNGYFIHTPNDLYLSSSSFSSIDAIPQELIDLMNNMYDGRKKA